MILLILNTDGTDHWTVVFNHHGLNQIGFLRDYVKDKIDRGIKHFIKSASMQKQGSL